MALSRDTLAHFMDNEGKKHPYNLISITRQGYQTKWLLMETRGNPGVLMKHDKLYCWRTSCLSHDVVQEIIVTKQGIPLPPHYCDVMDVMDRWGRGVSLAWYDHTCGLFRYLLLSPYYCTVDRKYLFNQVIDQLMRQKLYREFRWTVFCHNCMDDWDEEFDKWYEKDTHDFCELATKSIDYIEERVFAERQSQITPSDVPDTSVTEDGNNMAAEPVDFICWGPTPTA